MWGGGRGSVGHVFWVCQASVLVEVQASRECVTREFVLVEVEVEAACEQCVDRGTGCFSMACVRTMLM